MVGDDECQYYLLDDNRLYRRTEPPLPPAPKAKPKATSLKAQAAKRRERASKRRKVEASPTPEVEEEGISETQPVETNGTSQGTPAGSDVNTLGGYKWECVAITLPDYQNLITSLKKTKDPNEKNLRQRLIDEVIPVIEAAEEKQRRKIERRERELMSLEKMAHAKRSSRLQDKQEREKREQEAAEAERKRAADLAAAHREQEKQEQMEYDRQSRMTTREQRIKDREFKRILAEDELAKAAEEEKRIAEGIARGSERHLKERIAKNKKQLQDLGGEEDWTFDCSGCGVHGKNLDDGSHSVACEKCNVWQHSKCLGISKAAAEKDDFHFVCDDCKRKEERANQPKISLKFKVTPSPAPPSPARLAHATSPKQPNFRVEIPIANAPRLPSQGQINGYGYPPSAPQPYGSRPIQYYPPLQPNGQPASGYPRTTYSSQHYPPSVNPPQYPRPQSSSSSPPPIPGQQHPDVQNHQYRPAQHTQHFSPIQYTPNQYARPAYPPQPQYSQQSPHAQPRPSSSHGFTPRPISSHNQPNGQAPAARLPSPVLDRPIMSPSQGNYDVSPVAGISQKSPYGNSPPLAPAQLANGTPTLPRVRPHQTPSTWNQPQRPPSSSSASSATPQPYQTPMAMSAVSPTKRPNVHSPLPPPSNIPTKMSMSPPRAAQSARTVSGTPIIPPTEKLIPSPEQLSHMGGQEGVPTPIKVDAAPTPSKVDIMGIAAAEAQASEGVAGDGNKTTDTSSG